MAKLKKCTGKEVFQRMNYLCQISREAKNLKQKEASTFYSQLMINISKKTVQRLEPDLKQMVCKCCNSLLVTGVTCRVKVVKKHVIYKCLICETKKNFKATKDFVIWPKCNEAIVEVLDYNCDKPKN